MSSFWVQLRRRPWRSQIEQTHPHEDESKSNSVPGYDLIAFGEALVDAASVVNARPDQAKGDRDVPDLQANRSIGNYLACLNRLERSLGGSWHPPKFQFAAFAYLEEENRIVIAV